MAGGDSLLYKPTWAIASTCSIFILGSLIVERTIYLIGRLLVKYKQSALQEAFEKIKEELMMVGFISIALTIGQKSFSKICMPSKLSKSLLLCNKDNEGINLEGRLTLDTGERILATVSVNASEVCGADQTLFMPAESLHQLHILIFMLAIVHIFYTVLIVLLGMWSVSHWKAWEERANTKEALSAHGGIRLTRETTFMRSHILGEWMGNTIASYLVAFYKQFHTIINDTDYYTLRKGFIKNHMPKNPDFNFHKYIRRSLQDDFKHVVGISPLLWGYALLWLFLNVDGWESNIIIAVIPLIVDARFQGKRKQNGWPKLASNSAL